MLNIEDEELRTLFKAESEEHLQHLDAGLLRLESDPTNSACLEELFREAHSLKGAARMLGIHEVETVAHRFEGVLGGAKRNETALTSASIDRLYRALEGVRKLVNCAVTGEPAGIDVEKIIQQLDEDEPSDAATCAPSREVLEKDDSPAPSPTPTRQIETIRVESFKLDALMTEATELIVTQTRIAHRAAQTEQIISIWEEWNRTGETHRPDVLGALLYQLKDAIDEDNARLEFTARRIEDGVRAARLLPFSTIFNLFPRVVRDIARQENKEVQIVIQGGGIAADKRLLEEMKDPLMHMIRNAVDHGIESPSERENRGKPRLGTIRLSASQSGSSVVIEIADDGQGLNVESIKATALKRRVVTQQDLDRMTPQDIQALIFTPGLSTSTVITDISGRGVGLDVVRTNVEQLKGTITVESTHGTGCLFRLRVPATLATSHVLLVDIQGGHYALPVEYVYSTRLLDPQDTFTLEGHESILVDEKAVSLVHLADILELKGSPGLPASAAGGNSHRSCVVLKTSDDQLAVIVDGLLDEKEVIMKPLGGLLKRVRNVSGFAILPTGAVCTVLNPMDLIRSVRRGTFQPRPIPIIEESTKPMVLLVEDSITTRTWEKRALETSGYEVVTAIDGMEALQKLTEYSFDAVVSDVQMPRMDGLTLTERIRQDNKLKELPVILVTSLADEADRKRGIEAGANAYITKPTFDQKLLVDTLKRLV